MVAVSHPDALPGITRATLAELSDATERPVTVEELLDADEVFLTGTSAEVAGVRSLDEREFGVGPVTRELAALYAKVVRGATGGEQRWLLVA